MTRRSRSVRVLAAGLLTAAVAGGLIAAPAHAAPPTYLDTWCTDGTLTYNINTRGLSAAKARSAVATIKSVMRDYAKITGVTLRYVGKNPPTPADLAGHIADNIEFTFPPRSSMPTAGLGGGHYQYTDSGVQRFTGGDVQIASYLPGSSGMRDLTIHEVGHVFGLDHSQHRSSVMYPIVRPGARLTAKERRAVKKMATICPVEPATDPAPPQVATAIDDPEATIPGA